PSPRTIYVFNGDIVDRGPASLECLLTVLALKLCHPDHVYVNRGNHETKLITNSNGFRREARIRVGLELCEVFVASFRALPLGVLVRSWEATVFVAQGGVPIEADNAHDAATIEVLQRLDRRAEPRRGTSLLTQLLWNDPCAQPGRHPSKRGDWG